MLKRLALLLALTATLLAPLFPPHPVLADPQGSEQKRDCIVYATRTGHKYHRAGCRYLRRSSIRMTREDAVARGLTPCSVCGGSNCER